MRTRPEEHLSFTVERNIVWSGTPGKNFILRFGNAEKDDFRLKPGSPALALGFVSFDLGAVGPRGRKRLTVPADVWLGVR